MKTRSLLILPLLSAVVIFGGCRLGRISIGHDDHRPRRVTHAHRATIHVCTYDCHHHYWDGVRIVALATGHRHHDSCGHHWDGHHWVVRKARVSRGRGHSSPNKVLITEHRHGASCGHVFSRRSHKWIKVKKAHLHRRGCGHRHVNGRWVIH